MWITVDRFNGATRSVEPIIINLDWVVAIRPVAQNATMASILDFSSDAGYWHDASVPVQQKASELLGHIRQAGEKE